MPLKKGKSKKVISQNISAEMHAGKSQAQSIAIAMRMAGMSKHKPMHKPMHETGIYDHKGKKKK